MDILIVDDHAAVRKGLRSLISTRPGWFVCGEAADGEEAISKAVELRPDAIVMDISMPKMNGLEATRRIRRELAETEILIVSQDDSEQVVRAAKGAGARGFVLKSLLSSDLIPSLEAALLHNSMVSAPLSNAWQTSTPQKPARDSANSSRAVEIDFRDFAESAIVALHSVGPDGTILWANQAELDMLGYTREEYIGHSITDFHADQKLIQDILNRLTRGEQLRECEAPLLNKDGSVCHVLISSSGHFEDGKLSYTRCFTVDISDRKRLETALRQSEQRFREMIEGVPAAIYTTDAEGRITHFNSAATKLSGRVPTLGDDRWCVTWKLFRADGTPLPHDECPMAIALKEGRIVDGFEAIAERPDGTRVWFMPYPRPLYDASGKIIGGVNMLVDITERKRGEQATNLLAAIVDSSDDAIVSKNLDGIITSWNKGAERIFGHSSSEAVGQHITLLIPAERRDEEAMIIDRISRGQRVEHFETVRVRKDGTTIDVSLSISPVRDGSGRIVGASKVARDVTERKKAERALRESEEQLRRVADGLENEVRIRTAQLERRNAAIVQQSEQLRELSNRLLQTQDDERRRIARELHDSAGQIVTALAMNLANIGQQISKNPRLMKGIEESQDLIQQLGREVRTMSYLLHPPLLEENGLSGAVRWYIEGLSERSGLQIDLQVSDDFDRLPNEMELALFRIVQECLTNIHRHSGSKKASIRLSLEGDSVCLEVQDEGKGIPPEKIAGLQARNSGVGLTGMRERVRHFSGVMNIESERRGTKVSVKLPLPASSAAELETAKEKEQASAAI